MEHFRLQAGETAKMRFLPLPQPAPKFTHFMQGRTETVCPACNSGENPVLKTHVPIAIRVQFRFPRSKKVRIRKKWRNQPRNFKTQVSTIGLRPYQVEALKAWANR